MPSKIQLQLTLSTLSHTHRSSQNPDSGDVAGLGTRWGVSEGGLDGLGWVRNLIRFTESHPLHVPLEDRGRGSIWHVRWLSSPGY